MESFKELEKLLGYSFKNKELLTEALSHPSLRQHHEYKANKDYERLEFLGDAVLNLIITEILFNNFTVCVIFTRFTKIMFFFL